MLFFRPMGKFLTPLSLLLGFAVITHSSRSYAAPPSPPSPFRVENEWKIGGTGGWGFLALDVSTHQLYIPRTNRVTVVDTQTGKNSGEIDGLTNLRNLALDDSGRYGYATDPTDGTAGFVRVFDRKSLKVVSSIATGSVPAAIVFDPSTKLVFAFNSHSHSATVIDTVNNHVVSTIFLPGRPSSAVVDDKGSVFVALPALGVIDRIDAATKKVAASWNISPCNGPAGLAIDTVDRQLFTACENHKLVAIHADTGLVTVIADAPAASGDIDFNSGDNRLFVADATGTVTIFYRDKANHFSVFQQVKTQAGARTMVVNHDEEKVYLVTSKFGQNTATVSEELQFRPAPVPGTFSVIVVGQEH
jgi:YVTN family beta-propeller protein